MLYKSPEQSASSYNPSAGAEITNQFDLRWLMAAVLQRRWLLVVLPLVAMTLAVLFVLLRPPSFTASTQLQLTNLRLTFSREDAFFAETHPDPAFLETQLQIIRSDRVALSVLRNLKMLAPDAPVEEKATALEQLRRGFAVDRAGLSNVVQISYTTREAETAARVANEFALAYTSELNTSRLDAAQAGSSWLRERLREVGPKARVIAEALPPPHKSNLRGIIIILAAGVLSGGLAVAVAIAWKLIDRRVMTPEEAEIATGAECIGSVPRLMLPKRPKAKGTSATQQDRAESDFSVSSSDFTYALDHPHSQAWHTLRNVRASCQECFAGKGLRYVGVTSTFAGEGRSTIAANLALLIAAGNKRTLLVDGDIYDPGLSRRFASDGHTGLMDYLRDEKDSLERHVLIESRTGLHFLPLGTIGDEAVGDVWTDKLQRFYLEANEAYDYVIFDMPALYRLGDLRASARYIEGFLLVVGWQHVSTESIQVGLRAASGVHERLLGTVLNNVKPAAARWLLSPQTSFLRRLNNPNTSSSVPAADDQYWSRYTKAKKWVLRLLGAAILAAAIIAAVA